jgi:phosphonate transport system substrate-binding protein
MQTESVPQHAAPQTWSRAQHVLAMHSSLDAQQAPPQTGVVHPLSPEMVLASFGPPSCIAMHRPSRHTRPAVQSPVVVHEPALGEPAQSQPEASETAKESETAREIERGSVGACAFTRSSYPDRPPSRAAVLHTETGGVDVALTVLFPPSLGSVRMSARADLLRTRLAQEVGEEVAVETARDYDDMLRAIASGAVHCVWAPTIVCARLDAPHAVFKAVRDGRTTYCSALVTRADRVAEVGALRGVRAAWVDRQSLGGYVLARRALGSRGDLGSILAAESFVGSYPAVVEAILTGRADVGAVFVPEAEPEVVASALDAHRGAGSAHRLVALFVTPPVPNDAFVLTRALQTEHARVLASRWFRPATNGAGLAPGRPVSLCLAMGVDGFARADFAEYEAVLTY